MNEIYSLSGDLSLSHTSFQQHGDSVLVISECGIVKRRASTETSPAAELAAEFILSGHQY